MYEVISNKSPTTRWKDNYFAPSSLEKQKHIEKHKQEDSYISVSLYRDSTRSRTNDNILGVKCVYVDIDNHKRGMDTIFAEAVLECILERSGHELPLPTQAVYTGRGLQLVWIFKEPIKNLAQWHIVEKAIVNTCKEIIENEYSGTGVEVDNITDCTRVLRLPGTLNVKANVYAKTIYTRDNFYNLEDMGAYDLNFENEESKEILKLNDIEILEGILPKKTEFTPYRKQYNEETLRVARCKDLIKIQELRRNNGYYEGYRNKILHIYALMLKHEFIQNNDQKGFIEALLNYNSNFGQPLKQNEVISCGKSVWKSNRAPFTNAYMIKNLDITPLEQMELCTIISKCEANRRYYERNKLELREKAKIKAKERYKPIKTANTRKRNLLLANIIKYKKQGYSYSEIATKLGISKRYVTKLIKEHANMQKSS